MLTGGQLIVPFRVRLLGRARFWPRRLVRSSAESTTGEISLAFGHAMEVCLSCRLWSGVPPFTPYKVCLLLVMVGIFIVLLARNCNINLNLNHLSELTKYATCETYLSIGSGCSDTDIRYNCDKNFLKASKNGQCDNTQIHLFV